MKNFLQLVLLSALLSCGLNLGAQTPDVRVDRDGGFTLVKILSDYHWPYDISNNKKHIAIQGFGAASSYYWSEETGAVALSGYAFAVSEDGKMAGYYENNLGVNVAGLWSPETKKWEFLGMNPDAPEFYDAEYNSAWAMSDNGETVGVMQFYPDWSTTAYTWNQNEGYTKLPNGGSPGTRPNAISDDGKTIAGLATHPDKGEWTPCYWRDGDIHKFPHLFGEALNVSHNGNYVCGYLLDDHAFLYDINNDKLVKIANTLEPDFAVSATCVSNNGIVFGYSDGGSPIDRKAVVYVGGELLFFEDYLKINGIEEADTWDIYSINNVTEDGKTFIGAGTIDGEDCSFALTLEDAPCDGPTNLTYTIEDTKNIILKWDAPENAEGATYDIYINYTGAPFAVGITETTFTFDNMEAGEYRFLVRANYNNGECISEISNMVMPTVYPCPENHKCEFTVLVTDMYNDGWDNGHINIVGSLSDLVYTVNLTDSRDSAYYNQTSNSFAPDTVTLMLCPDTYSFSWTPGNWDEEVGFALFFQDEELYRVNFGDIDTTFKNKPTFFEYELNCEPDDNISELTPSFELYPNPVENKLFINTEEKVNEVSVYTITGVKVYNKQCSTNDVQLDVTKLTSGVYFIKIETNSGEITRRFIKE